MEVTFKPLTLTIDCLSNRVKVDYVVELENATFQGPVGNGEYTLVSDDISEKLEELVALVAATLAIQAGVAVGEDSPKDTLLSDDGPSFPDEDLL